MGRRSSAAAAGTIRISPKIEQLLSHILSASIHLMAGDAEEETALQIMGEIKQKHGS